MPAFSFDHTVAITCLSVPSVKGMPATCVNEDAKSPLQSADHYLECYLVACKLRRATIQVRQNSVRVYVCVRRTSMLGLRGVTDPNNKIAVGTWTTSFHMQLEGSHRVPTAGCTTQQ